MACAVIYCSQSEAVLAIMGERLSYDFANSSRRQASRCLDPSGGISHDASGQLLSIADHSDHRDIHAPKKAFSERHRSILEALVAPVAPHDAAAISKALMREFSTLGRVLCESKESLERVIGMNRPVSDLLLATHTAIVEGLRSEVPAFIINSTDQRLIDYLVATMGSKTTEALRIIFLSQSKKLVGDEIICIGSVNCININARCIFKRAFEFSATSLILVHNHPGGNVKPSKSDIMFTKELILLAHPLGIKIDDHIIISESKWFSFLRHRLI